MVAEIHELVLGKVVVKIRNAEVMPSHAKSHVVRLALKLSIILKYVLTNVELYSFNLI